MKRGPPRRVIPLVELGNGLLEVEKPSRYLGGESGSIRKGEDSLLSIALCFPDLYEIGMSNNAIRILYSGLNAMPGVRAERVFAPAPDFEALLERRGLPLYTLESGIALPDVDILGLSLGYELAATSVVTVLVSGRIPTRAADRGEGDPIVIAGGPAAANPHPLAAILDAAFIGEAEAGFFELAEELAGLKRSGAGRGDLLERLAGEDSIWMPPRRGSGGKAARRAVFGGFSSSAAMTALPIPGIQAVQDHGTIEIMRGCPNGCRFCQAGYLYRPRRVKPYEVIRTEAETLVSRGGHREITLASLSSGDYPGIGQLLDRLNAEWGQRRVSFQLPSLKINSFTLPIVRKLAEVRKSGLTFAVETPVDDWQRVINKDVSFEKTVAILQEARAAGFKRAKFYFMIGLPVPGRGLGEAEAIVEFFDRLRSRIDLQVNVNVGTFVPKPHTPYQWSAQLGEDESLAAMNLLRSELRRFKNVKLSYQSPFVSQLEGVLARGDERVGELILAAHARGARLDAWDELFDRELWRSVLSEAGWPVLEECCGPRDRDAPLPWDDIHVRVTKSSLLRESERSTNGKVTSACMENCTDPCGSCSGDAKVLHDSIQGEVASAFDSTTPLRQTARGRVVLQYSKKASAAYLPHLSIVDAFDRAFLMSGLDAYYSEGFNPAPRFETAQPLPIAVESSREIASLLLCSDGFPAECISALNARLPLGLRVDRAEYFSLRPGKKQRTIGSLEWGSEFLVSPRSVTDSDRSYRSISVTLAEREVPDYLLSRNEDGSLVLRLRLPQKKDHGLQRILEACTDARPVQAAFRIERTALFADAGDSLPRDFFEAYALVS